MFDKDWLQLQGSGTSLHALIFNAVCCLWDCSDSSTPGQLETPVETRPKPTSFQFSLLNKHDDDDDE